VNICIRVLIIIFCVRGVWYVFGDEYIYALIMLMCALFLDSFVFQRVTNVRLKKIESKLMIGSLVKAFKGDGEV